jgi:hypothetical protein
MLVGKPEEKRSFWRLWHRWGKILKWILGRPESVDWINMAQDRFQWWALVSTVMNLLVP